VDLVRFTPRSGIAGQVQHVRFVPIADIGIDAHLLASFIARAGPVQPEAAGPGMSFRKDIAPEWSAES